MNQSIPIPVNGEVLRWARVSANLSPEEVAARIKRNIQDIQAWERGEAYPTYVQLEKLAYEIYKRPLALFFFPEPPEEESIDRTFRTLPEQVLERIPSRLHFLLRKARVLQLNLAELYDGENPATNNILRDLQFAPSVVATRMAEQARAFLGIELADQRSWDGAEDALQRWRDALESHGVFVFKDSFNPSGKKKPNAGDSPFSGFCLYDAQFPLIYLDNNKPKTRQIFTLFHELAHLLMRTGGVDTRQDDYIEYLAGDDKKIEVLCNRFAAEFLVPIGDFRAHSTGITIDDDAIDNLAKRYQVSRETILRRFLDQRRVSRADYKRKVRQWQDEYQACGKTGGGSHYNTKGVYLGERYIETVFRHYHRGRISVEQAADYLGAKTKHVPKVEAWLFERGART
uniref:Zn-dependent peptidase ImmA, M78 family n=1 Tax=Candidatus Kentrum sp. SD TaxID=2126332 RepID=A0A450YX13_9GAMM|nr:MAG: Zn-dependent peptidase ImmA, M78 family [Candidatus Kentron sp. SD]VFK45989.1 MAG: Zn-dependent peptidase ImmA, M78 family [Candidatus Kentron sp. SD]